VAAPRQPVQPATARPSPVPTSAPPQPVERTDAAEAVKPKPQLFIPVAITVQEQSNSSVEKVHVNIYRLRETIKTSRPSIFCDDTEVVRSQHGRFVVLALTPGKHTFRVNQRNDRYGQLMLDLKTGQEYYIRVDIENAVGAGSLTLASPEQGVDELKELKPGDAHMIKDKNFLAADFAPLR
jgi:hypothetical protein